MSLLNDASLIQIPSGYKDGTLYSAKPTNGDGDFTFSRGSNLAATRVNSEGLIEKGRENLFFASDTSDSAVGRATRGSSTTIKGVSGFLYSDNAGNPNINKSVAGYSTGFATFSIYVDTTNANTIELRFAKDGNASNGTQAEFNATTKTWSSIIENTSYVSSGSTQLSFEDLGDNVFRLSIGANFTASGTSYFPVVYFGTGNTNVAIGGGQVERSLVATDYIETTTTTAQAGILEDMPRLDYSGGATCPSLLLEPQRSNLLEHSEYFDSYTLGDVTVTNNNAISPEGLQNAIKITEDTTNARHRIFKTKNLSGTTNDVSTSVFMKAGTGRYGFLEMSAGSSIYTIVVDLENGTITDETGNVTKLNSNIESLANGWYRCSISITGSSSITSFIQFGLAGSATPSYNNYIPTYLGTGEYIYAFGSQIEDNASYPTSYIPTYGGSSVTRSADSCSKTGISSLIGQTEGTLFIEANLTDVDSSVARGIAELNDGGTLSRITLFRNSNGTIRLFVRNGGTAQMDETFATPPSGATKIGIGYASNDIVFYVNGLLVASDTSATIPACSDLDVGQIEGNLTKALGDSIKQAIIFPTRLSNDELAELTTL